VREFVSEFLGTALLLTAIVGSGIMGERLAGGSGALALLANSLATGAALVALILAFGSISGAHFNPLVSFAVAAQNGLTWSRASAFAFAQCGGAVLGVGAADSMFGEPVYAWSQRVRSGVPQAASEFIATFGLVAVIWACSRRRAASVPFAVGAYIASAYWFTSSTSFANPAVTLARALTNTFVGIRPADVPGFVIAQVAGAAAATALFRWLVPIVPDGAERTAEHGKANTQWSA